MSKTVNVRSVALQQVRRIGSERQQLGAIGTWLQTSNPGRCQLFQSSRLAISKTQFSKVEVVVRGSGARGDSHGVPRAHPLTTSAPDADPAPVTGVPGKVPMPGAHIDRGGLRNQPTLVQDLLETLYKYLAMGKFKTVMNFTIWMAIWDNAKKAENMASAMEKWIEEIRGMFRFMTDGEISESPYDTAWVALVPSLDGSERPQFPKTLQWIIDNQFADGSWGDSGYFSYFDRVCNTLACIVALETWHTGAAAVERGVKFIQQNLQKMETEAGPHMMIGFEIVFPALIVVAQKLGLNLPYDAPIIVAITAERQKKLKKIPKEILHSFPTTLLHSLEGFHQEVNWEKVLTLQSENGSFLNSPAATAACLLHTKDEKALGYLNRLLDRFNNGVPNVYPVDLSERLSIVDRIQRLGIDRYFEREIKDSLDYVYKYFTSFGIGWARGAAVQDLDDTAMAFRLLRQHGYEVNEYIFRQFRSKNGEFFCFAGQAGQAVTGLFNLYRAAQTRFAGEVLLKDAEPFARNFLTDKVAKNECFDKWIISKDLAGEVEYALSIPWYSSLPWLETRAYLNHYGPHDVWIGKLLYRMPFVNNETFLALAKANFNLCQSIHQEDLEQIARWDEQCDFQKLSYARQKYRECFFAATMLFPPPELARARLVFARCGTLATVMDDYFDVGGVMTDMQNFVAAARQWDPSLMDTAAEDAQITFNALYNSVNAMTQEGMSSQGRDIGGHLRATWLKWLEAVLVEAEWTASGYWPSFREYLETALSTAAMEPIMMCSLFFLGEPVSDELVKTPKMLHLFDLVNRVGRLANDIQGHEREKLQGKPNAVSILLRENSDWTEEEAIARIRAISEESMRELVREVHQPSHIPKSIRQGHFNNARAMQLVYKDTDGYSSLTAMSEHVKKILYEPVY